MNRRLRTMGGGFVVVLVWGFTAPAFETASVTSPRVDFSILEDDDENEDVSDVAKDFERFHQLGVTTWRNCLGGTTTSRRVGSTTSTGPGAVVGSSGRDVLRRAGSRTRWHLQNQGPE
jgi:hypothetical protein